LRLPEIADYNLQQVGIGTYYNGLDDRTNPMKGSKAFADFKVGNKQISKSPEVADIVYDSINLKSLQLQLSVGGEINQRVAGPFVAHLDASYAIVLNQDNLFTNDLIRLGGVNSLRGFNEFELFVSSYALARVEARLIMSSTSRLFLFYDQAFTDNSISKFTDQPRGFGAGMLLDTGNGDLQLIYALGVSAQQSLSLAQSKIHIGYVARF
jgi:translocation and assembly module TamA